MLKVLIVAAALTFAIPTMSAQHQIPTKESQGNGSNTKLPIVLTQTDAAHQNAQGRSDQPPRWYKFVAWPEGITAWAILLTLIAISWQSYETRKSAKAALKSADAAETNAKIALRAIQSWITVEVRFVPRKNDYAKQGLPDNSAMIIILENLGGSPAQILRAETVAILSEFPLPESPVYISEEVAAIPGEIIPPGKQRLIDRPVQFCGRISEEDRAAIRQGVKGLYCWGMIEYTDSSGDLAITQFGHYWYSRKGPQDGRPEAMYRISNPQYNFTRRKAQANEGQKPN